LRTEKRERLKPGWPSHLNSLYRGLFQEVKGECWGGGGRRNRARESGAVHFQGGEETKREEDKSEKGEEFTKYEEEEIWVDMRRKWNGRRGVKNTEKDKNKIWSRIKQVSKKERKTEKLNWRRRSTVKEKRVSSSALFQQSDVKEYTYNVKKKILFKKSWNQNV
jgi:hypothetical protein